MKQQPGFCGICGNECKVVCSAYRKGKLPFIDGKNYEEICDCCHAAWKVVEWDDLEDLWVYYDPYNDPHLYSVDELIKDGWSKQQAKKSIKCIIHALKRQKKV
jgi:hypothetical protein